MILTRFRTSHGTARDDLITGISAAYGMWYAIYALAAPYEFGPNGNFPVLTKTSLETNAIDPISAHYLRFSGAVLLAELFHWYLCCVGRVEYERQMMKVFIYDAAIRVVVCARTIGEDVDGMYLPGVLKAFIIPDVLTAIWFAYLLGKLPPEKGVLPPVPKADRFAISFITLYCALAPVPRLFFGPTRPLFPPTTQYDIVMIHSAKIFGGQMMALLLLLLEGFVSKKELPRLLYQLGCFISIFSGLILYMEAYDDSYMRKPMIIANIMNAAIGFLCFSGLGAFEREKEIGKTVKASKAA